MNFFKLETIMLFMKYSTTLRWLKLLLFAQALCFSPAPAQEPLPLAAVANVKGHVARATLDVSPDGQWLAHTVNTADLLETIDGEWNYSATGVPLVDGNKRKEAILTRTNDGFSRRIGAENCSSWSPVWAPDGRGVAFYSDEDGEAGLWFWDQSTGRRRRLTRLLVRPFFAYETPRWHPNSRDVVCKMSSLDSGTPLLPKNGETVSVTIKTSGIEKQPPTAAPMPSSLNSNLVIVNTETGKGQILVEDSHITDYAISPNGRMVAYSTLSTKVPASQRYYYTFRVVDLVSGSDRLMADKVQLHYGMEWSWSPKSDRIAFIEVEKAGGRVSVASLNSQMPKAISKANEPNLDWGEGDFPPRWSADGKTVYAGDGERIWGFDTEKIQGRIVAEAKDWKFTGTPSPYRHPNLWVRENEAWIIGKKREGTCGFWRLNLESGEFRFIASAPESISTVPFNLAVSKDREKIYLITRSNGGLECISSFNTSTLLCELVSNLNPNLPEDSLGKPQVFEWKLPEGDTLHGTLLLPPNYESGPLPMVVWVYGGLVNGPKVSSMSVNPIFNFHVLASRGYAVFTPDMPLRDNRTLEDINRTALSGVDALVAKGYADPDRLAVMGQSYGAYSTLCLLTQTDRFKAAVITGNSLHPDLFAAYASSPGYFEEGQGGIRSTIWDAPELYRVNSPLFQFPKIITPILMGQGDQDSKHNALATFSALERLGKTAELRMYAGESHVLSKPANVVDFWERRLDFLETHLGEAK